jgi:hypothetical protein
VRNFPITSLKGPSQLRHSAGHLQVSIVWVPQSRRFKMDALRMKDGLIQSWTAIAQAVPGDESNGPACDGHDLPWMAGPDEDGLAGTSPKGQSAR